MMDTLPLWTRILLALLTVLGTTGVFTGAFSIWRLWLQGQTARQTHRDKLQLEQELSESKARIEALEIQAIKVNSAAESARQDRENMKSLIQHASKSDERWQESMHRMFENRRDDTREMTDALRKNTQAYNSLNEALEIQSEQFRMTNERIKNMGEKQEQALKQHQDAAQLVQEAVSALTPLTTQLAQAVELLHSALGTSLPQVLTGIQQQLDATERKQKQFAPLERVRETKKDLEDTRKDIEALQQSVTTLYNLSGHVQVLTEKVSALLDHLQSPPPESPPPAELFKQRTEEHDESENEDNTEKKDAA
jgi:hypothetical protein